MVRSVRAGKRVHADRRGALLRRHCGQAGRRGNLPHCTQSAGRRLHPGRHRRRLRRDQGRLPVTPAASWNPRARLAVARASSSTSSENGTKGETLDRDHLRREHELRPAALRGRARRGRRRARGAVRRHHPEERGSFRRFCELVGPRSVTEFNYRISDAEVAHVFVGVAITKRERSRQAGARSFERHGFATVDLTDDELAKQHVRHMVGGRTRARGERAPLPLHLPGAAGCADALPVQHAPGLEHQPVPLPQPGRGLWPHPGRHAGCPKGDGKAFKTFLDQLALPLYRRDRQSGVSALPAMNRVEGRP